MKRGILILIAVLAFFSAAAQRSERTYIATDRDWYAAGETVYLSAFCVDVTSGTRLSPVSAVAYVELASAQGMVMGAKVALLGGRGAGSLVLPQSLPSGNYRLSAYTALAREEEGYNPCTGSKIISVYNTLSTARVPGGVTVGSVPENPFRANSGVLEATIQDGEICLTSTQKASLSVSVFRKEPFPSYAWTTLADALEAPAGARSVSAVPEYDGEILTLRFSGTDGKPLDAPDTPVLVSRPGHPGDIYASTLHSDGSAVFYTGNFFGSEDMVVTMDPSAPAFQVEVASPFAGLDPGAIPSLVLDPALAGPIGNLGARMQVTAAFDADTLYQRLPAREIPFLSDSHISYHLDDYTRFATMREVFVEYLSDIRSRRKGDALELQVRCADRENTTAIFRDQPSLILVDGVPVLNHSLVYNLDPALVKTVEVYPYVYALGLTLYSGVANFITFKGDMGGIRFGSNVRILDFVGASYPVAFGPSAGFRYPNQRETLLWQPLVDISAGEQLLLPPLDDEGLVLVVEGLTASGKPLYFRKEL